MTQDELNRFLLDEAIKDDLDILSQLIAVNDLCNVERAPGLKVGAYKIDWARNLLAGSILARSANREAEEAALRIATGAITLSDNLSVKELRSHPVRQTFEQPRD